MRERLLEGIDSRIANLVYQTKLFNLTRQEKAVLLFLVITTLLGISINYLLKTNPRFNRFANVELTQQNSVLKVNLNKADINELTELPGIGPALAERIIAFRKEEGIFMEIGDIKKIKGIGEHKFERIKRYIFVEEEKK